MGNYQICKSVAIFKHSIIQLLLGFKSLQELETLNLWRHFIN